MDDEKFREALLRRLNGEAPPMDAGYGMSIADLVRWERALIADSPVMFDLLKRISTATPVAIAELQREAADLIAHVHKLAEAQPPTGADDKADG